MSRPQPCATHGTHARRSPTSPFDLTNVNAVGTNHAGNVDPKRATSRLKRTATSPSHRCECTS